MIDQRVENGRLYLESLESSERWNWEEKYAQFRAGSLDVAATMALVHPMHYGEFDTDAVRGPRLFRPEAAMTTLSCGAQSLWGYRCSRAVSEGIAADHLFPYGRGGPTLGSNKLYLCPVHNALKAGDVHLFPWERGVPDWVADVLFRIHRTRQPGGL